MNKNTTLKTGCGFSLPLTLRGIAPKKVVTTLFPFNRCQECQKSLEQSALSVKYKGGEKISLSGYRCFSCNTFYLENSVEKDWLISALAMSFQDSIRVKFDNSFCTAECLEYKRAFDENKNHCLLLILQQIKDGALLPIIITTEAQAVYNKNVYNYINKNARSLLCWAIKHNPREEPFRLNETSYLLLYHFERNNNGKENVNKQPKSMKPNLCVSHLEIKKGGGLKRQANREEIVVALVYSMFTHNYETINVTYNKNTHSYYVDIRLFRLFVQKYGKPDVQFSGMSSSSSNNRDSDFYFNTESFLHMYGYNVGSKDALTDAQRSSILAEIIDLGYMSPHQIVVFLHGLISMRKPETYKTAIAKWNTDIEFVKQYRINPSRFVILES